MFPPAAEASPLSIHMAKLGGEDPDAYARHMVEHMAESGRGGSPHFAISRTWSRDEVRSNFIARLAKGLDEPLWGRAWLLAAGRRVVGHLELRGGRPGTTWAPRAPGRRSDSSGRTAPSRATPWPLHMCARSPHACPSPASRPSSSLSPRSTVRHRPC